MEGYSAGADDSGVLCGLADLSGAGPLDEYRVAEEAAATGARGGAAEAGAVCKADCGLGTEEQRIASEWDNSVKFRQAATRCAAQRLQVAAGRDPAADRATIRADLRFVWRVLHGAADCRAEVSRTRSFGGRDSTG